MKSHATLILCDLCARAIPDVSAKEVLYQVGKTRYRLELCASCLQSEMQRHDGHRGVPGFHKRAALVFSLPSEEVLPTRAAAGVPQG